jgi:hypothetical protein
VTVTHAIAHQPNRCEQHEQGSADITEKVIRKLSTLTPMSALVADTLTSVPASNFSSAPASIHGGPALLELNDSKRASLGGSPFQ